MGPRGSTLRLAALMGVLPLIPRSRLSRFGLSILASAVVLVGALPSPPAVHAAPGPDMVVEKSASVSEVPIDGEITYTITARNVGTEDATGVRIRDTRIDPELIITAGPTATPGMDCRFEERDGKPLVEFSWLGSDESDDANGRGWAVLEEDGSLNGRIYFHQGDDSAFTATRSETLSTKTRPRRA